MCGHRQSSYSMHGIGLYFIHKSKYSGCTWTLLNYHVWGCWVSGSNDASSRRKSLLTTMEMLGCWHGETVKIILQVMATKALCSCIKDGFGMSLRTSNSSMLALKRNVRWHLWLPGMPVWSRWEWSCDGTTRKLQIHVGYTGVLYLHDKVCFVHPKIFFHSYHICYIQ